METAGSTSSSERFVVEKEMVFVPEFMAGRELSRLLYEEAVRPLLAKYFPHLPYAAAHVGKGSDVLGFDTEMSRDHDWGPAVFIFLKEEDKHFAESIRAVLSQHLPREIHGYPVGYSEAPDEPGTRVMAMNEQGPVNHRVLPMTLQHFVWEQLAYDSEQPISAADWLTFSAQALREIVAGTVHYDGIGEPTALRERLVWYPHAIWLYLLAAGWQRIGQEEHLMSRAGYVGDELGSALIGSRLVRDIMNLCFLMEKQYAPYPKWFGTAFRQLECAQRFEGALRNAQNATNWQERETAMCEAYEMLAKMHNALGLTEKLPEKVRPFFGRPFKVIHGSAFAEALIARIMDPEVKRIASRKLIGSIDQFSDSTDLRAAKAWRPVLRKLYE